MRGLQCAAFRPTLRPKTRRVKLPTTGLIALVLLLISTRASAAGPPFEGPNVLVGPMLGFRFGSAHGPRVIVGAEGGVGWGPERANLGIEWRYDQGSWKALAYAVLEPWFFLGVTMGLGVDVNGVRPVVGLWEGLGLALDCDEWSPTVSIAIGYRYSGVPEIYLTPKVGVARGTCPPNS